jgi:cyanophycinase
MDLRSNMKSRLFIIVVLASIFLNLSVHAQEIPERLLIPFGPTNSLSYSQFSAAVVKQVAGGSVHILLLPITLSSNSVQISDAERTSLFEKSEIIRTYLKSACQEVAPPGVVCEVSILPVFVREDALKQSLQDYFPPDISAVFIPDGDNIVASQIAAGTLLEKVLKNAYENGVVFGGSGAGGALLSPFLIAPHPSYTIYNSLEYGSIDLKNGLGLIKNVILDQNLLSSGNFSRLLNAITLPGVPQIGVGLDVDSGVEISNGNRIKSVTGSNPVVIIDAKTYHAADAVEYTYPRHSLSLRNVLVHVLSPNDLGYDLESRLHDLGPPQSFISRQFEDLKLPASAGPLILGGDISSSLKDNPILIHFFNLSGGEKANILIVASGYSTRDEAQQAVENFQASLPIPSQTLIITSNEPAPAGVPSDVTGMILLGDLQEQLNLENLQLIKQAWSTGIPLFTNGAATTFIGAFYLPNALSASLKNPNFGLPGLNLLNVDFVSGVLANNRWHNLFELGYRHPNLLAVGLDKDTALEINPDGVIVLGENSVIVFDLQHAILGANSNQGIDFANGLLDVFTPGERILPEIADINLAPLRAVPPRRGLPGQPSRRRSFLLLLNLDRRI